MLGRLSGERPTARVSRQLFPSWLGWHRKSGPNMPRSFPGNDAEFRVSVHRYKPSIKTLDTCPSIDIPASRSTYSTAIRPSPRSTTTSPRMRLNNSLVDRVQHFRPPDHPWSRRQSMFCVRLAGKGFGERPGNADLTSSLIAVRSSCIGRTLKSSILSRTRNITTCVV